MRLAGVAAWDATGAVSRARPVRTGAIRRAVVERVRGRVIDGVWRMGLRLTRTAPQTNTLAAVEEWRQTIAHAFLPGVPFVES